MFIKIVLGFVVGLLWGAFASFINSCVGKACAKKNSPEALSAYGHITAVVGVIALAGVFLIIKFVPVNSIAMIIGTALSMSSLGVLFALKLASGQQNKE